jgi:hypothetical protein
MPGPEPGRFERSDQPELLAALTQPTGEVARDVDPIAEQRRGDIRLRLDHRIICAVAGRRCFT